MTEVQQGTANIELVRRVLGVHEFSLDLIELFGNDANWAELRAAIEPYCAEDCTWAWLALGQRTERRGLDGLREGWLDWFEPWVQYRSRVEEVRPIGDDRVLAFAHETGTPQTGAPVEMRAAAVITIRDGRISAVDFHATREDALAAVAEDA